MLLNIPVEYARRDGLQPLCQPVRANANANPIPTVEL